MKKFKSQIIPIPRKDIDTDLIIPAEFLTVTTREGLGKSVFNEVRKIEKDFPMNLDKYQKSKVIVARHNFGCGSSREHAAWALSDWGIRVVIAPSFADIFYNNALKNGILPLVLDEDVVERIFEIENEIGNYDVEVDLESQKLILPDGEEFSFEIDPYRKECLMKGMDDLDYLILNSNEIENYEKEHLKKVFFDTSNL